MPLDKHAFIYSGEQMKSGTESYFQNVRNYFPRYKFTDKPDIRKLYIKIPSFPGILAEKYGDKYIKAMHKLLRKAYKKEIKEIILDLIMNDGGQDNIMISSLAPLLPQDTKLYYKIDGNQKIYDYRYLDNNKLLSKTGDYMEIKSPYIVFSPKIKIIIGEKTASAGEILVLCFYHLKNVTFKGNSTFGILTDMYWNTLPSGLHYSFTRGKFLDKLKHPIKDDRIVVDYV